MSNGAGKGPERRKGENFLAFQSGWDYIKSKKTWHGFYEGEFVGEHVCVSSSEAKLHFSKLIKNCQEGKLQVTTKP